MLGLANNTSSIFNGITGVSNISSNTETCHFDGSNDYITVSDADNLSFVDGDGDMLPYSIAFWCERDSAGNDGILAKGANTGTLEYRVFYHSVYGLFTGHYDGGSTSSGNYRDGYWQSGFQSQTGWHHVIITFQGSVSTSASDKIYSGYQVYKNGVLQSGAARGSDADGMSNFAGDLIIGKTDEAAYVHGGHIAQLTMWKNYKLTASDIDYLYNDGTIMRNPTIGAQDYGGSSKVVLWLPLQDNYNDASKGGNDGTNSGTTFEAEVDSNWA